LSVFEDIVLKIYAKVCVEIEFDLRSNMINDKILIIDLYNIFFDFIQDDNTLSKNSVHSML
jgi:hypothetical protein